MGVPAEPNLSVTMVPRWSARQKDGLNWTPTAMLLNVMIGARADETEETPSGSLQVAGRHAEAEDFASTVQSLLAVRCVLRFIAHCCDR
jgi:hypothetical protein